MALPSTWPGSYNQLETVPRGYFNTREILQCCSALNHYLQFRPEIFHFSSKLYVNSQWILNRYICHRPCNSKCMFAQCSTRYDANFAAHLNSLHSQWINFVCIASRIVFASSEFQRFFFAHTLAPMEKKESKIKKKTLLGNRCSFIHSGGRIGAPSSKKKTSRMKNRCRRTKGKRPKARINMHNVCAVSATPKTTSPAKVEHNYKKRLWNNL